MIGTIARLTLKRLTRGRALWVAVAIAMLPVIVAAVVSGSRTRLDVLDIWAVELLVLAVIPALFVASSVGEDIEDRTITYLWSRPLPRWQVIVGKLAALAPIVVIVVVAGWWLAIRVGTGHAAPMATLVGLGAAALAISMVASGIGTLAPKHGMALTIIYMLLFDLPIGEIPASLQVLSISHQSRLLAGIASHDIHDRVTPGITMAVIALVWFALGLWKIRRTEA